MSKKTIIATIIFSVLSLAAILAFAFNKDFNFRKLTTDSGFDSSWDSGSSWDSWDSGSSWDSSSSWDNDYDYDWGSSDSGSSYSYSSGGGGGSIALGGLVAVFLGLLSCFVVPVIFHALITSLLSKSKKSNSYRPSPAYVPKPSNNETLSAHELELLDKYGIDKEKLLHECYHVYVDVQKAWANNDIEPVKNELSNTLYNTYKSELVVLKAKHQRNVMDDFYYSSGSIKQVSEPEVGTLNVEVYLNLTCKDYLINDDTGEVLRGQKTRYCYYYYEMKFELSKELKDNRCPNCNAPIPEGDTTHTCEYCGSLIVKKSNKLVMTGKKMIRQS